MRTIKFRGKRKEDGKWIYGYLADEESINNIGEIATPCEEVDPSTIGQFSGLTDRNGKEIYEGDIMTYGSDIKHLVEFKHGMFGYTLLDGWFVGYGGNSNFSFNPLDKSKEHEVIGNILDNPELLKGGEK